MFYGTVPTGFIQQMVETIEFCQWGSIHVCCSGSFKVDRALRIQCPEAKIFSNDVSLYSSAIGALLSGNEIDLTFVDRLAFIEDVLRERPFLDRVAALLVAFEMSRYRAANRYCERHFNYYQTRFDRFLDTSMERLSRAEQSCRLNGYSCGDWRDHVDDAIERRSGIVAFPPFFKGDYEQQFRFLEANVRWSPPQYDIYDPDDLHDILVRIDRSGVDYCLLTDQLFDDFSPILQYVSGRKVPHYGYGRTSKASVRRLFRVADPVAYKPIDVSKVTACSKLKVMEMPSSVLDFFKDVYLAKSIIHTSGIAHYLVSIDDMTVGGIVYTYNKRGAYGPHSIYLLSDVTLPEGYKLSKMVAKLATSREVIRMLETKILRRIDFVVTTARTPKPVSMKYRGIYKKLSLKPGEPGSRENVIQYGSQVRPDSIQDIFDWWYQKYVPRRNDSIQDRSHRPTAG